MEENYRFLRAHIKYTDGTEETVYDGLWIACTDYYVLRTRYECAYIPKKRLQIIEMW